MNKPIESTSSDTSLEARLSGIEQRLQVLDDQQAIVKLKAQYVNYNDGGWEEQGPTHSYPDAVADLFVDDGIWDGRPSTGYAEGKEEIRQLFTKFQAMPFIIHYVTNPLIEIQGDEGTGHWHAMVTTTMPNSDEARWILGVYKETYRRVDGVWKFNTLRFESAANSSYEQGWGKEQFVAP